MQSDDLKGLKESNFFKMMLSEKVAQNKIMQLANFINAIVEIESTSIKKTHDFSVDPKELASIKKFYDALKGLNIDPKERDLDTLLFYLNNLCDLILSTKFRNFSYMIENYINKAKSDRRLLKIEGILTAISEIELQEGVRIKDISPKIEHTKQILADLSRA